ncbi:MAG: hypothetical protein HY270_21300, partial [Deltaproteobacteria bacterium]|nr:hypothetical protein [Deltaproteobacteria bacterium]
YRVSHTTAYKIRHAFLEGGREALSRGLKWREAPHDLEARVRALEAVVGDDGRIRRPAVRAANQPKRMPSEENGTAAQGRRASK